MWRAAAQPQAEGSESDPPSAVMWPSLVCSTLHSQETDPGNAGACCVDGVCSNHEGRIDKDVSGWGGGGGQLNRRLSAAHGEQREGP